MKRGAMRGIPLHELFFSVLKINKTVNCIQNIFKSIPWSLLYIGFEDFSFVFTESSVKGYHINYVRGDRYGFLPYVL